MSALYDDTFTGARWTYGLQYRPLGFAQVPNGWIIGSAKPDPRFMAFGVVSYPRELTEEEVRSFQLAPLTEGSAAE